MATNQTTPSQLGPHGYPLHFSVRRAGRRGLKICGEDYKQGVHFLELFGGRNECRQVLHRSAHKKDESAPIVSVLKPRGSWAQRHVDILREPEHFKIDLHRPGRPADRIDMNCHKAYPSIFQMIRSYRFQLIIPGNNTTMEVFEWRDARGARSAEVRSIRKKGLPPVKTGDVRPPHKKVGFITKGYVLVRLTGRRYTGPPAQRPLGFTEQGEEIVASYAVPSTTWIGRPTKFFFQFWGAGARGELGEEFSHVAALTGSAIWQDEMLRDNAAAKKQQAGRRH